MKAVQQFSDGERTRLREAVLGVDDDGLRRAGVTRLVVFQPLEEVSGRTIVGTSGPGSARLDVTARKAGPGDWRLQVRHHGRPELLLEVTP